MTTYEYEFCDGKKEMCKADYWEMKYNPRSGAFEYVFYSVSDVAGLHLSEPREVRIVPTLWVSGTPVEVK